MVKSYEKQLEAHIKALEKGYDNVIILLNDDLEKDENDEITLKDDKKKIFADGVLKLAEASDALLARIKNKKDELEDLQEEGKSPEERSKKIEDNKPKKTSTSHLKD